MTKHLFQWTSIKSHNNAAPGKKVGRKLMTVKNTTTNRKILTDFSPEMNNGNDCQTLCGYSCVLHHFNLTLSFKWIANWITKSISFLIILHLDWEENQVTVLKLFVSMAEIWIYTTPQNRLHVANAFALNAIHAQNTLNLFSHVLDSENLLFFCLIYNNHCVAMFISSA